MLSLAIARRVRCRQGGQAARLARTAAGATRGVARQRLRYVTASAATDAGKQQHRQGSSPSRSSFSSSSSVLRPAAGTPWTRHETTVRWTMISAHFGCGADFSGVGGSGCGCGGGGSSNGWRNRRRFCGVAATAGSVGDAQDREAASEAAAAAGGTGPGRAATTSVVAEGSDENSTRGGVEEHQEAKPPKKPRKRRQATSSHPFGKPLSLLASASTGFGAGRDAFFDIEDELPDLSVVEVAGHGDERATMGTKELRERMAARPEVVVALSRGLAEGRARLVADNLCAYASTKRTAESTLAQLERLLGRRPHEVEWALPLIRMASFECSNTIVFSGQAGCLDPGSCVESAVTLQGLSNVVPKGVCDGTLWIGPSTDALCTRYGFDCQEPDPFGFEIDGDGCADLVMESLSTFVGVSITVPCEGNDAGELLVGYCLTWTDNFGNIDCTGIDGIVSPPAAECNCGQVEVPDIKVCPTNLTVTSSTSTPLCVGDGVHVAINILGIPTDAVVEYAIKDEDGDDVGDDAASGPLTGTTMIEVLLKPDVGYTIDVTTSFSRVDLACDTLSFDLEPICSCGGNDENCVCNPATDLDCPSGDLICCSTRDVCDERSTGEDGGTAGEPHMTGFLGQKFDFTGEDGEWYSIIADSNMNVNMRITSPVADLPEITYITGLSVLTTDADGFDHSIVIEVADPHSLDSSCPAGVSPCLADGALSVFLDGGEALSAPGTVSLGPYVGISAANLPGACRSFGFEKYWERKKLEYANQGRHLMGSKLSMAEWILADPTATNMDECMEYVAQAEVEEGGVFAHQSEHTSFQIVTPEATIRLSHGRLHQIAMRDPTDEFDLPDHLTWQMNMTVGHNDVSRAAKGVLGETFVPTRDASGKPIMTGMEAIRGKEEDYRVEGPVGMDFVQGAHTS